MELGEFRQEFRQLLVALDSSEVSFRQPQTRSNPTLAVIAAAPGIRTASSIVTTRVPASASHRMCRRNLSGAKEIGDLLVSSE